MSGDTICAPATTVGSGAISVIRVSGPQALETVGSVVTLRSGSVSEAGGYTLHFGSVPGVDDVMVSVFRAPHSYTGEDAVELSCHASAFVVQRILELLVAAGARMAEPGEFTRRAFLNGKMDLAQAEAVADLIASNSAVSHSLALRQLRGEYSGKLRELRDSLVEIAALLELELDFSEEDVEFASRDRMLQLLDETIARVGRLAASFRDGNALRSGVPVAIVGAPNSGKSTLLNALLGESRALVSDEPGTTRDTVEETLTLDGILYRFIDTAGIRETSATVEKMGIERSLEKLASADLVLGVLDACSPSIEDDTRSLIERVDPARQTLILLRNKVDLAGGSVAGCGDGIAEGFPLLDISALRGTGLDELRSRIIEIGRARFSGSDDGMVTNLRHYEALRTALDSLNAVRASLLGTGSGSLLGSGSAAAGSALPPDLLAEDLRAAISSLNSIFGENLIDAETLLGHIFERFCIGK